MNITLYSTHCPSCKVIETKLGLKNLPFTCIDDTDEVVKFGEEHGIKSAPILVVDDQVYDLKAANAWLKTI